MQRRRRFVTKEVSECKNLTMHEFEVVYKCEDRDIVKAAYFKSENERAVFYDCENGVIGIVKEWIAIFKIFPQEKTPE